MTGSQNALAWSKLGDFVDAKYCMIKIEQVIEKGKKFQ